MKSGCSNDQAYRFSTDYAADRNSDPGTSFTHIFCAYVHFLLSSTSRGSNASTADLKRRPLLLPRRRRRPSLSHRTLLLLNLVRRPSLPQRRLLSLSPNLHLHQRQISPLPRPRLQLPPRRAPLRHLLRVRLLPLLPLLPSQVPRLRLRLPHQRLRLLARFARARPQDGRDPSLGAPFLSQDGHTLVSPVTIYPDALRAFGIDCRGRLVHSFRLQSSRIFRLIPCK